jgi:MFS transporter, DHA1 family, tetracycline resistance protein
MAIGQAIAAPSLVAWVSKRAPADRQGELLGLTQSAGGLARVAGPGLGGLIFDHVAHAAPFQIAALLLGLAAAGTMWARR